MGCTAQMNKLVTELALYDIANVVGVAADISHCNTPVKVTVISAAEVREVLAAFLNAVMAPSKTVAQALCLGELGG